ncbi:Haloalkane dehalogenase [Fusarium oxysporum f. sp. albedinis]|nr:Haloalkane dehalogenase [Fusarium oxysporum f. sp. albedinis]
MNTAQKTEQDKDGVRSLEMDVSWWGSETLVGWLESTWMQLRSYTSTPCSTCGILPLPHPFNVTRITALHLHLLPCPTYALFCGNSAPLAVSNTHMPPTLMQANFYAPSVTSTSKPNRYGTHMSEERHTKLV